MSTIQKPRSSARRCVLRAPLLLVLTLTTRGARADLRFSQPAVNVGVARTGVPLAHRFAFVNEGPDTVEITATRAGCGCLTPHLARRVYPPGETGSLQVEIHTLGQAAGPHTWSVQVQSRSAGAVREVSLQLSARVVCEVSVQPAALTMFADRAIGHDLVLTDLRAHPLTITQVRSSSPRLMARLTAAGRDNLGNRVQTIRVEMAEDFPEGRHEEILDIYTDDPTYRDLQVPVTIVKRPRQRLTALPDRVTLTALPGVPLPARIVRLRAGANQAVVVQTMVADDPAITCHWAPGPGDMATLKITVDHQRLTAGRLHSAVHVQVSEPVPETVTIPVSVNDQ